MSSPTDEIGSCRDRARACSDFVDPEIVFVLASSLVNQQSLLSREAIITVQVLADKFVDFLYLPLLSLLVRLHLVPGLEGP